MFPSISESIAITKGNNSSLKDNGNDNKYNRSSTNNKREKNDDLTIANISPLPYQVGHTSGTSSLVSVENERQIMILMLLAQVCSLHDPTPRTFIVHVLSLYEKGIVDFERIKFLFDLDLVSQEVLSDAIQQRQYQYDKDERTFPSKPENFGTRTKNTTKISELISVAEHSDLICDDEDEHIGWNRLSSKSDGSSSESNSSWDESSSSDSCAEQGDSIQNYEVRNNAETDVTSLMNSLDMNGQSISRTAQAIAIRSNLEDRHGIDLTESRPSMSARQDSIVSFSRQSSTASTGSSWTVDEHPLALSRYQREFIQLEHLSSGAFGDVYLTKNKLDGNRYAIKKVLFSAEGFSNSSVNLVVREVRCLANCNHPNCVRYYTSWLEPSWMTGGTVIRNVDDICPNRLEQRKMLTSLHNLVGGGPLRLENGQSSISSAYSDEWSASETDEFSGGWDHVSQSKQATSSSKYTYQICLFIQMELCTSKTLSDWIRERDFKSFSKTSVEESLDIFRQITSGLAHVHSKDIIHRDLKPANIFLSEDGIFKIGDFGLSKLGDFSVDVIQDTANHELANLSTFGTNFTHTAGVGTASYASPEQINSSKYGKESDIFSLGLILLELFSVFGTEHERYEAFLNCRQEGHVPPTLQEGFPEIAGLILECTQPNPKTRPTAKDILSSPILQSNTDVMLQMELRMLKEELHRKDKIIEEQSKLIEAMQNQLKFY